MPLLNVYGPNLGQAQRSPFGADVLGEVDGSRLDCGEGLPLCCQFVSDSGL
jgi:hypothetical protein